MSFYVVWAVFLSTVLMESLPKCDAVVVLLTGHIQNASKTHTSVVTQSVRSVSVVTQCSSRHNVQTAVASEIIHHLTCILFAACFSICCGRHISCMIPVKVAIRANIVFLFLVLHMGNRIRQCLFDLALLHWLCKSQFEFATQQIANDSTIFL